MVRFYDFLFLLVYKFYAPKESGAASSAAGIVGGLQAINILTAYMTVLYFISPQSFYNYGIIILVFLFFQVTTYRRYIYRENNSIQKVEERWLKIDEVRRNRLRIMVILYIFFSIFIFAGLAIYVGSTR